LKNAFTVDYYNNIVYNVIRRKTSDPNDLISYIEVFDMSNTDTAPAVELAFEPTKTPYYDVL